MSLAGERLSGWEIQTHSFLAINNTIVGIQREILDTTKFDAGSPDIVQLAKRCYSGSLLFVAKLST